MPYCGEKYIIFWLVCNQIPYHGDQMSNRVLVIEYAWTTLKGDAPRCGQTDFFGLTALAICMCMRASARTHRNHTHITGVGKAKWLQTLGHDRATHASTEPSLKSRET